MLRGTCSMRGRKEERGIYKEIRPGSLKEKKNFEDPRLDGILLVFFNIIFKNFIYIYIFFSEIWNWIHLKQNRN
jgi:hypothetical protein